MHEPSTYTSVKSNMNDSRIGEQFRKLLRLRNLITMEIDASRMHRDVVIELQWMYTDVLADDIFVLNSRGVFEISLLCQNN